MIINSQMAQTPRNQKALPSQLTKSNFIVVSSASKQSFSTYPWETKRSANNQLADFNQELALMGSNSSANRFSLGLNLGEDDLKASRRQRENQLTDAGRYANKCLEYQKCHFDSRIRLIIQRIAGKAYHNKNKSQSFLRFFLQKLLSVLAKKLLLNRYELLFLDYVFELTNWGYESSVIASHTAQFRVYVPTSDGKQDQAAALQLYLLYCAYYSKRALNQIGHEALFAKFLNQTLDNFKEKYNEWSTNSNVNSVRISPKRLNSIFKQLTNHTEKERDYLENYSLIVESIIEISPAYNADKTGKSKKAKKNRPQDFEHYEPREEFERPSQYQRERVSSSRVSQLREGPNHIPQMESQEFQYPPQQVLQRQNSSMVGMEDSQPQFDLDAVPQLKKKQASFVSNVDGFDAETYVNPRQRQ